VCGVKISKAMKSSVSEEKKGSTEDLCENLWEMEQATLCLAMGGAKDLKPEKPGRKPLVEGRSVNERM